MKPVLISILFLGSIMWTNNVQAQERNIQYYNADGPKYNLDAKNLGVQGYDPVEYHMKNRAAKGYESIEHEYDGVRYLFASEFNKQIFKSNPERFLPAYGGYCAFGLGMNNNGNPPGKYPVNPKSFKIIEGKLHLFYLEDDFNALRFWNENEVEQKIRADSVWLKLNQ